jgi:hypothetical protein
VTRSGRRIRENAVTTRARWGETAARCKIQRDKRFCREKVEGFLSEVFTEPNQTSLV